MIRHLSLIGLLVRLTTACEDPRAADVSHPRDLHGQESLLGDHSPELVELGRSEAAQVVVDGIDTRHRPTREVTEQWTGSQPLEVEHARGTGNRAVNQQLYLRMHWVDHASPNLHILEQSSQLFAQSLLLHECVESREPSQSRQARVGLADPQCARVGAPHSLVLTLPLPPLGPLASESFSSHLLGARRASCCWVHQRLQHARRASNSRHFVDLSARAFTRSLAG